MECVEALCVPSSPLQLRVWGLSSVRSVTVVIDTDHLVDGHEVYRRLRVRKLIVEELEGRVDFNLFVNEADIHFHHLASPNMYHWTRNDSCSFYKGPPVTKHETIALNSITVPTRRTLFNLPRERTVASLADCALFDENVIHALA